MTRARREVMSLDDTPYYHFINRCVRRVFLCGGDRYSNKVYSPVVAINACIFQSR